MILEVRDIHCYYDLSHAVHGLSLSLDAGEIVSLLGRNGAGKSTTIHTITGIVRPRSGEVRLAATPITHRPPHEICRQGVGWVPQGRRVFPRLTVEDNLRLAMLKVGRRSLKAELDRSYGLFPILRERRDTFAGTLSGGEQQMLAIARALVGAPRVLLLDEPTEGLSPLVVRELMRVVRDVAAQGMAVLLAEQNVRMALSVATRHYILDKGQVQAAATTREIESRPDLLTTYLGVAARTGQSRG
jgi:branched-chain amino acid transport system ATP-binding protein